jgi:hypothetical protein
MAAGEKFLERIPPLVAKDQDLDLIGGSAGAILGPARLPGPRSLSGADLAADVQPFLEKVLASLDCAHLLQDP